VEEGGDEGFLAVDHVGDLSEGSFEGLARRKEGEEKISFSRGGWRRLECRWILRCREEGRKEVLTALAFMSESDFLSFLPTSIGERRAAIVLERARAPVDLTPWFDDPPVTKPNREGGKVHQRVFWRRGKKEASSRLESKRIELTLRRLLLIRLLDLRDVSHQHVLHLLLVKIACDSEVALLRMEVTVSDLNSTERREREGPSNSQHKASDTDLHRAL